MSTTEEMPDPLAVWTLINSHVVARCIHMIADFGVPDALDGEPASADELAARTGMDADALARMLRLLSAHGLFAGGPDGTSTRRAPSCCGATIHSPCVRSPG